MVEIGGRNPPLPPNFVTLRQLRERRPMEAQDQAQAQAQAQFQNPPVDRSSMEEKSDNGPRLPPNYVSLRQLREQRLKKKQEKEKEKEGEKVKVKEKEKAKGKDEEKGGNYALVPPNYVSLRQLRELRLKEKEKKEAEEEVEKAGLQQIKEQEKGDESRQIEVEINKKAANLAGNLQSKRPYKLGHMKSSLMWRPVFPSAGTSTGAGAATADAVFVPEIAGASGEVAVALSDQNGDTRMKEKKKNNKQNKKRTSGKNKAEVVKGPQGAMEVTRLKVGEAVNASNAIKEVTASRNENNTVKKGKGEKVNVTKSSSRSVPVLAEVKGFNGVQAIGFKIHKGRDKEKGKEVNLTESSHNVVPVSEVAKASDGAEEVIGSKIENGKEKKGKGKMVDMPELSDQIPNGEEAKGFDGLGEVIGSEIQSGEVEEKGRGENVNVPESSKWTGPVNGYGRRRKQAAGIRGWGDPRAGRFTGRAAAEHLRGGRLVWCPRKVLNSSRCYREL